MSNTTEQPSCANFPVPVKEHEWLRQFVGEWDSEAEIAFEPGQPPTKTKGSETARAVGGFWIVAEGSGQMEGMPPFQSRLTLGYDPGKKKYIGTWVDSMSSYLWRYEGTVDPSGRILTLETEGYTPDQPGKLRKFKEVTEFKSPAHRVFTSSIVGDDGSLNTCITVHYRKK